MASGIKALLLSCFVAKPKSSSENVGQLMQNISEFVERGVQVALPSNGATPSCTQSIEFAIATGSKEIASLKTLKSQEPELLSGTDLKDKEKLLDELAKRQMTWKNAPIMRASVKWVERTPGVMMSSNGLMLSTKNS